LPGELVRPIGRGEFGGDGVGVVAGFEDFRIDSAPSAPLA
jgi:hypothetical protein